MSNKKTGTVKWFDPVKSYGFILQDDGSPDVFVHITELRKSGIQTLMPDQKVSYEIDSSRGKPSACNLTVES